MDRLAIDSTNPSPGSAADSAPGTADRVASDSAGRIMAESAVGTESAVSVAEAATVAALLRCCVREVAGPRGRVWQSDEQVLLEVGGRWLRARAGGGIALRLTRGEWLRDGVWEPLSSALLVELITAELGGGNPEFAEQVASSRSVMEVLASVREEVAPPQDPWLASEQALVFGHPFHPTPKARIAAKGDWLSYAPEAYARFPLRLLGVREDLVVEEGDPSALDRLGAAPAGYRLLPVHPWQYELLDLPMDGRLIDLGFTSGLSTPTSSVRTVYEPDLDKCLKFSLDVRITNCVRKNAWYELSGSVELSRRLAPVFADLAETFPGTRWLPEPGYRSADLGTSLLEGLGVLVRCSPWGRAGRGVTPVLAGALAVRDLRRADAMAWWVAYVERVALPVLDAYFRHGVVLEAHLQNVLVGLDSQGMPVEAVFRDLEGTKLVGHDLSGLVPEVAAALEYDAERGWNRVVYCLFVNHLAEIAATLEGPRTLRDLWAAAGELLACYADTRGWPPPLAELLAGVPLPAKANLAVRWSRSPDKTATYVQVANPLSRPA
ncbi:iron transporter [Acrocarpospora corrugata]|uniref:Iron transporter n=1 Tax=Acrocarpospora corrugata TaxID=35763 RepID=A0A5M3W976_9ACTN|nr:IucA/IucC family protein [Acrocarpospora corrugata]GES05635.1 iron transporter [Acrocarpospora corrugata]